MIPAAAVGTAQALEDADAASELALFLTDETALSNEQVNSTLYPRKEHKS